MLLNIRESEEQKIYVSSDFHLGHQRDFVWQARGFTDVQSHDTGVIDSVNALVRPNDILLFLGDFCLNTTLEQFDAYLARFNCQNIWCIWGNHNNPHEKAIFRKAMPTISMNGRMYDVETYPFKYKNIVHWGYYAEMVLNGQYVVLMHYPIYIWNEMAHGAWMLCGHSHYGCPLTKADNLYGKILDVGWDGYKKPLSLNEIAAIMNNKQFAAVDNHHINKQKVA